MEETTSDDIRPVGPRRLYRSRQNRMFLGVCGGLGEYFDLDPTIVRLLFAIGALVGGASIVVYAVLALIMPAQDSAEVDPRAAAQETLNEATSEIQRGVSVATEKVKGIFNRSG